jgi:hypothetical protein
MKKYFVLLVLCTIGSKVSAQYVDRSFFKAGIHAGVTLGDAADFSNLGMGLDLYQHWGVSKMIDIGLATGVQYYFGLDSTIDIGPQSITTRGEDTIYLPLAALFRFYPTKTINLGGDIGYAVGLNDFTEGGFYYRPTLSFDLSPSSALNFSYMGIQGEAITWSTVTGGVIFRF